MYQPLVLDRFDDAFSRRTRPEDWQTLKALRDHPRFLDGVVAYDDLLPEIFANNIALNRLVTQVERMQTIAFTLHLYDSFDPNDPTTGLTVSRLQHFCTVHNLASNGGVVAFMALMTVAGYLTRQRSALDRRVVHYAPTPKFMDPVNRWTRAILASIDAIEPEAQLAASFDAHPRFGWDMREASVQAILGGWAPTAPFPEATHFINAHGGWMLMCHATAILLRDGGCKEIVPISIWPIWASDSACRARTCAGCSKAAMSRGCSTHRPAMAATCCCRHAWWPPVCPPRPANWQPTAARPIGRGTD